MLFAVVLAGGGVTEYLMVTDKEHHQASTQQGEKKGFFPTWPDIELCIKNYETIITSHIVKL